MKFDTAEVYQPMMFLIRLKPYSGWLMLATSLVVLLSSACSWINPPPSPTLVPSFTPSPSETLAKRPTRTATPTVTATLPPTETTTPTLNPTVTNTSTPTPIRAIPGASFRGEFQDGFLTFSISEDGRFVEGMRIVIRRSTHCKDGKRLGMDYRLNLPMAIAINEYGFPFRLGFLDFRGWFSTARTVRGTIFIEELQIEGRKPCTLGPIDWSGAIE